MLAKKIFEIPTMTFQVIYKREYPLVQIGIKRAEMPLNDFLDTAETIRPLELEYNHVNNSFLNEGAL